MDAREWRTRIEWAKEREVEVREGFLRSAVEHGIEYTAEWKLDTVTEARVNHLWWTRVEAVLGAGESVDLEAVGEVLESAHHSILTAYTSCSTNPVANAISAYERDALARWYRETAGMLQHARRDEAAATTAEVK